MERIQVLQIITRLIVGGAQETVMLVSDMLDPGRFDVTVMCGPQTGTEGSLIGQVRARGIPLIIEPSLVREISPLKDLRALVEMTRFIRRNSFDVVHTNSSKAGILGRWAAWLARTPVIVHTVHGWGHNDQQRLSVRRLFIILERLTLRTSDKLIVVSPLNIEKGLEAGIGRPEDYVVIRSGIELERFGHPLRSREEVRASLCIPSEAPVIGSVTRLSPQKAPLDFVRAASLVAASLPEAYFVLVGDGPLRSEVEETAADSGLSDRLIMTGLRPDVPELMAAFDVFALSSLWEGLPRVLPQAMATGLPIVATAIDGSAEAVRDGVTGLLVSPGDPVALAESICRLLADRDLARAMGAAGKARVEEYGDRRMVAEIAALYEQLLNRSKQ